MLGRARGWLLMHGDLPLWLWVGDLALMGRGLTAGGKDGVDGGAESDVEPSNAGVGGRRHGSGGDEVRPSTSLCA